MKKVKKKNQTCHSGNQIWLKKTLPDTQKGKDFIDNRLPPQKLLIKVPQGKGIQYGLEIVSHKNNTGNEFF